MRFHWNPQREELDLGGQYRLPWGDTPRNGLSLNPSTSSKRVECFFHDLKRFRAVVTRYDKAATSDLAVLRVASMLLWLR
ncbi:hypothetical protein [Corallococcus sp. CA053C]|uniref:hypothetical protein n=1 Tax=Corallococcus sp. CA053C TaxID=2316732 RepID=UPI0013159E36|nr:hypothetical protein [Corallococcus sp. CA053C]